MTATEPRPASRTTVRRFSLKRAISWIAGLIFIALTAWAFIAYWTSTNECDHPHIAPKNPMKAIVRCEYGNPDVLRIEEVEKPVPNDDQALIKVHAASINAADGHFMRGPMIARVASGLRKPREIRMGIDFAGVIETVGKNVTQFKPGDAVFSGKRGALADYVCVREQGLALKPSNITFDQAAAVPVAGLTALQGLRDYGHVRPGQKVLINGASGGVGTFAVQIAKSLGAEVTAVCSTRNLDQARAIGADHVIDYTKEDFTKMGQRYDVIFDNVCNHSFFERRRVLNPNGICVLVGIGGAGAHEGQWMRLVGSLRAMLASRFVNEKFVMYISKLKKDDLALLAEWMQSGKITPVIEETYPFGRTADAFRHLETGHARGKLVITLESPNRLSTGRTAEPDEMPSSSSANRQETL